MSKPASRSPSRNLSDSGLASYKPLAGEDADGVTSGPSTWSFTRTGSQQATSASAAETRRSSSKQKGVPRREPSLDLVAGLAGSASGASGVNAPLPVLGSGASSISEPGRDEAGQRSIAAGPSAGSIPGDNGVSVSSSLPDAAKGSTPATAGAATQQPASASKQGSQTSSQQKQTAGADPQKQGQTSPGHDDASTSDQTPTSPPKGKADQAKQDVKVGTPAGVSTGSQQAGAEDTKSEGSSALTSSTAFILVPNAAPSPPTTGMQTLTTPCNCCTLK